jgi:hypothetical protein
MSRTDKTRPFWVKRKDYEIKRPRLTEEENPWTYRLYEHWRGEFRCGCMMCGYDSWGTPRRKRDRAETKRIIRNEEEW